MREPIAATSTDPLVPSGVAGAVLREVATLLAALAGDPGWEGAIDLRGLPVDDAARAALRDFLGCGEVDASCDVAGASSVRETSFCGVWWVVHRCASGAPLVEQIVVARAPALLLAHPADIVAAHRRLVQRLDVRCGGCAAT